MSLLGPESETHSGADCPTIQGAVPSSAYSASQEPSAMHRSQSPYSIYAKSFLGLRSSSAHGGNVGSRRRREFTPDSEKDSSYWVKRKRNNEAARRSRQRRRVDEILLESRAVELLRENEKLKATLSAVQYRLFEVGNNRDLVADRISPQSYSTQWLHHYATNRSPFKAPVILPSAIQSCSPTVLSNLGTYCMFPSSTDVSVNPKVTYLASANTVPGVEYLWSRSNSANLAANACSVNDYLANGANFGTGHSLFQDKEILHYQYPVASSINESYAVSCEDNRHSVKCQDQDLVTKHKASDVHNGSLSSQQLRNDYDFNSSQNNTRNASGLNVVNVGTGVHCFPYKLRFKANSLQTHSDHMGHVKSVEAASDTGRSVPCRYPAEKTHQESNYSRLIGYVESSQDNNAEFQKGVSIRISTEVGEEDSLDISEHTKKISSTSNSPFARTLFRQY